MIIKEIDYIERTIKNIEMQLGGSYIVFDIPNMAEACLIFLSEIFEKYEYVPKLKISIDNNLRGNTGFFEIIGDKVFISINSKHIYENKYGYKNKLDTFIYHLLHEFGHLDDMLSKVINDEYSYLEDFFYKSWKPYIDEQLKFIKEKYKGVTCSENEIFATRFAFKNLSYFRDIYNFNGGTFISEILERM